MTKLLTVASNGQISIGKEWAGKQILIERVSAYELRIVAGSFIPENEVPYHSKESKQALEEFDEWTGKNPPKKTDRKALMARVGKKISEKNKNKT